VEGPRFVLRTTKMTYIPLEESTDMELTLESQEISTGARSGGMLGPSLCWPILLRGDCRDILPTLADESVQCCVTSPPYWGLRDYGHANQIGAESTPLEYVSAMVAVFEEVRRVLRKDGTLWLNLGDSYAGNATGSDTTRSTLGGGKSTQTVGGKRPDKFGDGLKPKDLVGIPWRVALALQSAGWYLRQDIIWHKPNPMPESVMDRCTKCHEYIFLLSKSERYYYDHEAIKEPSKESEPRNKRTVWTVPTKPYKEAHFAVYPPDLIKPCIMAGTKQGDTVLDPFGGSGTTGQVAMELGRQSTLIEINTDYANIIEKRTNITPSFL
jgi:DNA modification methylase